ncbi:MAG: hypothetical protein PVG75_01930 [Thioalkalispiraceae bacterium]
MSVFRRLSGLLLVSIITIAGCQQQPQNQMILFLENEEGAEPYQTRILITPKYIRFDEGEQSRNFLLIDRKQRIAYSVDHNIETIMRVENKDTSITPPMELIYSVKEVDDLKDAPTINDIKPVHRQLLTNDQICLDVVSVQGLMPEAVEALKDYHLLLASDSAATFNIMPADMHEPCAISMSTFAPTRHLEYGFPIQEWKPGYTRILQNYDENYQVDPELLKLPEEYFTYSIQEFREGRVDIANRQIIPPAGKQEAPPLPVTESEPENPPAEDN